MAFCDAGGFDISRNMVHTGWAVMARHYCSAFGQTEEKAKAAKRGLWKGAFTPPWEWRAEQLEKKKR